MAAGILVGVVPVASFKILFLDIDGVLNSGNWWREVNVAAGRSPSSTLIHVNEASMVDPIAIMRLNKLGDIPNLRVVLTSSQRRNPDLKRKLGNKRFLLTFHNDWRVSPWMQTSRRLMVRDWLDKHRNEDIMAAAILDCESDFQDLEMIHVQVDHKDGVQLHHVEKVRMLMDNKVPDQEVAA